jgi:hypothetical protein
MILTNYDPSNYMYSILGHLSLEALSHPGELIFTGRDGTTRTYKWNITYCYAEGNAHAAVKYEAVTAHPARRGYMMSSSTIASGVLPTTIAANVTLVMANLHMGVCDPTRWDSMCPAPPGALWHMLDLTDTIVSVGIIIAPIAFAVAAILTG